MLIFDSDVSGPSHQASSQFIARNEGPVGLDVVRVSGRSHSCRSNNFELKMLVVVLGCEFFFVFPKELEAKVGEMMELQLIVKGVNETRVKGCLLSH